MNSVNSALNTLAFIYYKPTRLQDYKTTGPLVTMLVRTLNLAKDIHYISKGALVDLIRTSDIMCLQNVDPQTLSHVKENSDPDYNCIVGANDTLAIVYRRSKLTPTVNERLAHSGVVYEDLGVALGACFSIGNQTLSIVNVALTKEVEGKDKQTQMLCVLNQYSADADTMTQLVCGDFGECAHEQLTNFRSVHSIMTWRRFHYRRVYGRRTEHIYQADVPALRIECDLSDPMSENILDAQMNK